MDQLTEEQLAKENAQNKANTSSSVLNKPSAPLEKKLSEPKKAPAKKLALGQGTLSGFFSKS